MLYFVGVFQLKNTTVLYFNELVIYYFFYYEVFKFHLYRKMVDFS